MGVKLTADLGAGQWAGGPEEFGRSPLLEEAHERRPEGLHGGDGHLLYAGPVQHEAAVDRLELQILGHVRLDQDLARVR